MKFTSDGREICQTELEWQKRRIEVWIRDGRHCVKCFCYVAPTAKVSIETNTPVAHIHHKRKRSLGRDDRMENLETRCGWCHLEAENDPRGE